MKVEVVPVPGGWAVKVLNVEIIATFINIEQAEKARDIIDRAISCAVAEAEQRTEQRCVRYVQEACAEIAQEQSQEARADYFDY
jgi:hypothetical protein